MLCWFSDSFSLVPLAIWKVSVKICGMGITGFIGPIGPSPAKNEAWHHTLGQAWFTICASIYSTHAPKAIFLLLQFLPSTTWGVVPFPLLCSEAAHEFSFTGRSLIQGIRRDVSHPKVLLQIKRRNFSVFLASTLQRKSNQRTWSFII